MSWGIDFRDDFDSIEACNLDELLDVVNCVNLFGAVLAVLREFWV